VSDGGDQDRKIKVVDRRRFDESGELRPDRPKPDPKPRPAVVPNANETEAAAPPTADPGVPGAGPPPAAAGSKDAGSRATSPLFLELVGALAQQAEILIAGAQGIPAQPAEAQRVIDYLAMLESKTAGNLSAEEQQVLSNVVFQLRALYVQHTT
jgi:hypothetical protein